MIEFNLNDPIWIRLNDKGRQIHKAWYEELGLDHVPATEDSGGWSKWQTWEVLQVFGSHVWMGSALPFALNARMDSRYTQRVQCSDSQHETIPC